MKAFLLFLSLFFIRNAIAQLAPFYDSTYNKYGYKDPSGKVVVTPKYDLAYGFDEERAAVRLHGKYGFLDKNGKEVIPLRYEQTWKFIGGYAAVRLVDKFGLIDKQGKVVVPIIYEDANNYHGDCCYKGKAFVREHGKWRIITIIPASAGSR